MRRTPGARRWTAWFGAALGLALAGGAGQALAGRDGAGDAPFRPWTATPDTLSGGEYEYSLTARVRPLVFWITRPAVGTGRIVRAEGGGGGRVYELLIGSDPARAPMHINRWGYVAEIHGAGGAAEILGVMTEASEQTVEDAGRSVERGAAGEHAFKAIRATVGEGEASAQVVRVALEENLTLRDLDALLGRLPEGGEATARVSLPEGVRHGFLDAVANLIAESLEEARAPISAEPGVRSDRKDAGTTRPGRARSRPAAAYVWDRHVYDLTCSSKRLDWRGPRGASCLDCLDSEFRIRNRTTGNKSGFRLTYPVEGPLAGIPARIVYRPRWWFEAELTLKEAR